MCQQNAAVVAILNEATKLSKTGKEPVGCSDFVKGGNASTSESWCCNRCQHSFVEGKDEEGESNPDSKDGMRVRFMKKTFLQSGITVVLAARDIV